ncbi:MAG: SAF domain-containing protein [Chloroflexi bacterium]|nr:SAF domain-containing protein [Chloroflexota bacterium]
MAANKKRNNRVFIFIILILAVGAVLVYFLLTGQLLKPSQNQTAATATPNYELVDIVIASQFIPRGSLITGDVLTTIKYPKAELPQGTFFSSIEEAVGTKAKYNIDSAVPLTTSMVIHENGGSLASFDIPAGMTAFSLPASPETVVAYAPQKGDHVMVVACLLLSDVDTDFQSRLPNNSNTTFAPGLSDAGLTNSMTIVPIGEGQLSLYGRYELDTATNQLVYVSPSETQRPRLVCQTVIQDAMVLQVGMFPLGATTELMPTATPIVVATEQVVATGPQYPGSITLVVSPQDTLVLNYLLLSGAKLSMALRSAGDSGVITTDPVTLQYVMDQKNIPSPLKLPYSVEPRIDSLIYPGFNDYLLLQP